MSPNSSAGSIFGLLFPWYTAYLVTQVAGEVARECRASLWQRVHLHLGNMSIAEIRGYVRAYAAGYVGLEVNRAVSRRNLRPGLRRRVADAAVDQLVNMVAHDVVRGEIALGTKSMAA